MIISFDTFFADFCLEHKDVMVSVHQNTICGGGMWRNICEDEWLTRTGGWGISWRPHPFTRTRVYGCGWPQPSPASGNQFVFVLAISLALFVHMYFKGMLKLDALWINFARNTSDTFFIEITWPSSTWEVSNKFLPQLQLISQADLPFLFATVVLYILRDILPSQIYHTPSKLVWYQWLHKDMN